MNDFFQKLQIFSRTEMAILRITIQTVSRQIALFAVGIVLILLAVALFNADMYMSLSERFGNEVMVIYAIVCSNFKRLNWIAVILSFDGRINGP